MPVANKYDIHEAVDACRYYFEKTGRRVTFEYSLVGGVNDSEEDAAELCALTEGMQLPYQSDPGQPDQGAGLCAVGQAGDRDL